MKVILFFDAKVDSNGSDASLYKVVHSILKGYASLVSQRTFTDVHRIWIHNAPWWYRNKLILPVGNWQKMKKRSLKAFLATENLLAIYFDKLPFGEAERLNSYLYDHEDYLGACQVTRHASSLLRISRQDAYLRLENRKVTILIDGFDFFERKRDIVLEEIVKSLPFDSWKYDSRRSHYHEMHFPMNDFGANLDGESRPI
jgi:hypothetical protein